LQGIYYTLFESESLWLVCSTLSAPPFTYSEQGGLYYV